jgi:Alpha-mannosidase
MDRLIDILQKDSRYECFNLDGQLVVLEDYLEIRPEMRQTLQKLVKSGRIGIGPWYVQADEFLSDGESLIRNLLPGMQLAREFGEVQKLAYLPDTFGHNSQIPQIARQFGISYSLIWRGVSGDELPCEII